MTETMGGDVGALVADLALAVMEITGVSLDAKNDQQGYRFASDEAILSVTRKALAAHGLVLVPTRVQSTTVPHATAGREPKPWVRTDVLVTYLLAHKGGGWLQIESAGSGHDSGDKGVFKALTGALKYAARGVLLLPVGLDPETPTEAERDERPTRRTREQIAADKAAKESADKARREGHDPTWAADRARFAAACNEAGVPYEAVAEWCEAHSRPRPSAMPRERREALLTWLRDPDHVVEIIEWSARRAA